MAASFREKGALVWFEAGGSRRATGERTSDDASTGDNSHALRVGPSGLLDEEDAAQAWVDPRHSARRLSQRAACVRTPPWSLIPFMAQTGGAPETLRRRCSSQPSVSAPPAASRTSGSAKCGLAARHSNSIPIPRFSTLPKQFPPSFQPLEVSITPCLTNSLR